LLHDFLAIVERLLNDVKRLLNDG